MISDMQRMKFAYARGARIQVPDGACRMGGDPNFGEWVSVGMPYWSATQSFRIHPDDAHLEYGPVSSGIRARALDERGSQGCTHDSMQHKCLLFAENILGDDSPGYDYWLMPVDDWRMYLLFIAEAMADQGL